MADMVLGRRVARNDGGGKRVMLALSVAGGVLILIGLGELIFHIAIAPRVRIERVILESDLPMTREDIFAIAGIRGDEHYFSFDAEAVQARLEAFPAVRSAQVQMGFPDTVRVSVTARTPLAVLLAGSSGGTAVVVDQEGYVFEPFASPSEYGLPVLSGLRFENSPIGARLPEALHETLRDLEHLRLHSPAIASQLSELRISRRGEHEHELVLYTVNHRIPVRIGSHLDEELLKYVLMVLDVLRRDEGYESRITELDFRTGEVVFRLGESE